MDKAPKPQKPIGAQHIIPGDKQAGREAASHFKEFHSITRELLAEMKASEEAGEEGASIGAHLLRIRDAAGQKLPDERLLPHIGMFFFAGFDTTGHTMAWTLCAAAAAAAAAPLLY